MVLYVVAIETLGDDKARRLSGLALCAPGKPPVIFTIAEISLNPPPASIRVSFITKYGDTIVLNAKVVASGRVKAAETAFKSLSLRGWGCGMSDGTHFPVHLLRAESFPQDFSIANLEVGPGCLPWAAWNVRPDDEWAGAGIQIIAAPFGTMPFSNLSRLVTEGVIVNVSDPHGLLLLDARRLQGSSGGAVVLTETLSGVGRGEVIACLGPTLRPSSRESIAFCIAVPLAFIFDSIIDDAAVARHLLPEELGLVASAPSVPRRQPSMAALQRIAVRRSVALLWLETTGSWASGIIMSSVGHILTCGHFLTGHSWVESPPEVDAKDAHKKTRHRHPPKMCRGRVATMAPDGRFVDVSFEADVLHIFNGCLDVALLLVRQNANGLPKGSQFVPITWPAPSFTPVAGREVCAVGYGLFGLGTPWQGPAITRGHITKVTYGEITRRLTVIQSSAAVHRGCSGGALVDACSGELVGLVTTNVKHQDGTVMPHVNFSLPVTLLSPLRDFLAEPDLPEALNKLVEGWKKSSADAQEQSLWRLEPEYLALPSPIEERRQMALDLMDKLAKEANADEAALGSRPAVDHGELGQVMPSPSGELREREKVSQPKHAAPLPHAKL